MKSLAIVFCIFLTTPSAFTQPQEPKLQVATRLIKPFVFEESGQLTGFSVELWQEIAKDMNVTSEFLIKPTVVELLDSVMLQEVALGIAAISVTAEREVNLDFSQPMFDAGLMFTSVIFMAYCTATVTSSLTLQQLRSDINGPADLPGKRVASVRGSTAVEYLHRRHITVTEFANVEEAYGPLQQGQADTLVYDAPVLLYYAAHEGKGKVRVIGSIFREEDYGIVFPSESSYRKPVNEALLKMKENGVYEQLYKKWFGSNGP